MSKCIPVFLLVVLMFTAQAVQAQSPAGVETAAGQSYYVSSSAGDDNNDGLSESSPLASIEAVNNLALQPGDQVLFKCGDVWRAEMLMVTASGTAADPLVYSSYPAACDDKPVLSGAQPISGWSLSSGNIYVADLGAGDNAGQFENGLNQLIQAGERLRLGRWPNLDEGDNGYSTINSQPAQTQLVDSDLPAQDWSGAVAHIKGMRWYILNRLVDGSSGSTLTLTEDVGCWDGDCTGWGYFLNNHLATLDQDGEWFFDEASGLVYLYSSSGLPSNIEGSPVVRDDTRSWGGIVLGTDLQDEISYVTIENFEIRHWYRHGIATTTNLRNREHSYVTIQNNRIYQVDGIGINLATWVYNAEDGENGWRGGNNMLIAGNSIDGANHKGIDTYSKRSIFEENIIRNIGLIENLGASGMGCDFDSGGGNCTEDGAGIRVKISNADDSGNNNTIRYNHLSKIAHNGIDLFGYGNVLQNNLIEQACYAKGDCGAIRTFGRSNMNATDLHDITIDGNIIIDTIGNTDGAIEQYKPLFGMGLYIDNYSRNITVTHNTVISSTINGVLYQRSTGLMTNNVLYNNNVGTMGRGQVGLDESSTLLSQFSGNLLYGLKTNARTLTADDPARLGAADNNYYFQPYVTEHISVDGNKTLAEWQAESNLDGNSVENWFNLNEGDAPRSRIFYNASQSNQVVDLGNVKYLDLDQQPVVGTLTLEPYRSQVLIADGFLAPELQSLSPDFMAVDEVTELTITLSGVGFTEQTVARWQGVDLQTYFINSSQLTATIVSTSFGQVGTYTVSIFEPTAPLTATTTLSLPFRVLDSVSAVYLPAVVKE